MTRLSAAAVCLIFLVSAALADDASRNALRSMRGKNAAANDQAADDLVSGLRWTHSIPELDSMPEEPPQHRALWPKISAPKIPAPKISPPKIKSPDLGNLGKTAGKAAGAYYGGAAGAALGGAVGSKFGPGGTAAGSAIGTAVGATEGAKHGGRLGENAGNWAEDRLGGSFGY